MTKVFTLLIAFIITALIITGLVKQISDSLDAGKRLDNSVTELNQLQKENRDLKDQLSYVQSDEFIETTARDKLNLAKPNETVVIIPHGVIDQVLSANTKPTQVAPVPHWKGWLKLVFKRSF